MAERAVVSRRAAATAMAVAAVSLAAASCGPINWHKEVLKHGAVNIGEEIAGATQCVVSIRSASFSHDSGSVLAVAISAKTGVASPWVYRIADGSLIETGLRPGWTLATAAFWRDSDHLVLAVERPEPPTYKMYSTAVGSTEWANVTDMVHSSYVDVNAVSMSPDRETVAVLSTGEGHSDVAVSRGGELLCDTAVYPGFIEIVGWSADGSLLFVSSDMPLDLGLDAESRGKNSAWDESMRDGVAQATYAIDPEEGRAERVDPAWVPDPSVSPDGLWKLHLVDDGKGTSELFLTKR